MALLVMRAAVTAIFPIASPLAIAHQEEPSLRASTIEADAELAVVDELTAQSKYREVEVRLERLQRLDLTAKQKARALARLAGTQVELGRCEEALRTADEAEPQAREAGADDERIRIEIARGSAWACRGFPFRGLEHNENALALAERLNHKALRASALSLLSTAHQKLGDWSRALDYTQRAFEARENPSDHDRFLYHANRGIAFYEFNDRAQAESSFRQALDLARRAGRRRDESWALGELGLVALNFDSDHARALELFDQARSIARETGVVILEVIWLNNTGTALRDYGDFESALARFREGLALEERAGQRRERPYMLKNIGQVLSLLGRHGEAEPFLLEALEAADRQSASKIRWQARMELGLVYRALGDAGQADRYFGESLAALEANQSSVLLEGFRVGMLGRALEQYDPYDHYIDFLLDRGESETAFAVAERARARVFLETLTAMRAELLAATPRKYLDSEMELLRRISDRQSLLRSPDLPARERRSAIADIAAAEDALSTLRLRLAVERPALTDARFPRLWSLEELREKVLGDGETLALYFLGRNASTVWIAGRRGMEVVRLPGRTEIEESVGRLLPTLQSPQATVDEGARSWLSRTLAAPLLARVSEGDPLIVVPHAILSYLPFEVLRDDRGRHLVERNPISYAPSASSFAFLRQSAKESRPSTDVLAVGSPLLRRSGGAEERSAPLEWVSLLKPLPHSGAEIRRVEDAFEPFGRRLEGGAATEPAVQKAALGRKAILHFATHALIDEEHPERSGLALSPGPEGSDGILQTREVYGLDLDAALVTLSACQTALGREATGEGMVAMSRAFFYAGARAVAASLWNVSDRSTAALMTSFYDGIREGRSIDLALAEAKRSFLSGPPEWQHPYYWAPFVVTGHAHAALDFPPRPARWVLRLALGISGAAVIAAVVTAMVWRWRKRDAGPA
jgi:CHAT domain-containing protein/tetratricopeptide (TPR) repeat protein